MANLNYSRQRSSIKKALCGRTDHPTAEELYACLRKDQPRISLGTVYRNLALLCEIGEIRKITTGQGPDRFDGNTTGHYHFVCRVCHSVHDIFSDTIKNMLDEESSHLDGLVESCTLNFYGICSSCVSRSAET